MPHQAGDRRKRDSLAQQIAAIRVPGGVQGNVGEACFSCDSAELGVHRVEFSIFTPQEPQRSARNARASCVLWFMGPVCGPEPYTETTQELC